MIIAAGHTKLEVINKSANFAGSFPLFVMANKSHDCMNFIFQLLCSIVLILILLHCRVGEKLSELLEEFQFSNSVSVIATAPSVLKINSSLLVPRGQHIFKTVLEIPELNKVSYYIILFNANLYLSELM